MLNTCSAASKWSASRRTCRNLALLAGALGTPGAAHADTAIGFVEGLSGINSSQCQIKRAESKAVHCLILSEVSAGDRIEIAKGGELTVMLYSGERKVFAGPEVTMKADPDNAESSVQGTLRQLVMSFLDREETTGTVVAAVRGDESRSVAAPLLDADVATLAAGQRALVLPWSGGVAPYALSIASDDPVLELASLPAAELPRQDLDLTPGDYTLTITDANGTEIERDIEVVPAEELPKAPDDPGLARLPAEYRTLAQAGWLSQQEDGRWRWEAYLELQTLPPDFAPGRLLAETLATGSD